MNRYLRWRGWWLTHAAELHAFKWGFAIGVMVMGLTGVVIVGR